MFHSCGKQCTEQEFHTTTQLTLVTKILLNLSSSIKLNATFGKFYTFQKFDYQKVTYFFKYRLFKS
jgi:hypothetical protein